MLIYELILNIEAKTGIKELNLLAAASEKDARKILDDLKSHQNHDMLILLEEEQRNEAERDEKLLECIDVNEKKKLEKNFTVERTKAFGRIQKLTA